MQPRTLTEAAKRTLRASLVAQGRGPAPSPAFDGARAALLVRPLLGRRRRVGLYCAMPGEVATAPLARLLWQDGCGLYLPVTVGRAKDAELRFACWTPSTKLARHPGGMLQPEGAPEAEAYRVHDLDAVVVPGLAFDLRGGRLGRGWGCYDRALAGYAGLVVGLAHPWQLLARLPHEAHDCGVDVVVTPVGAFATRRRSEGHPRPTAAHATAG